MKRPASKRLPQEGYNRHVMSRVLPVSNSDGAEEEDEFGNSIERNVSSFLRARRSMANRVKELRDKITYENFKKAGVWFLDLATIKISISVSVNVSILCRLNTALSLTM